MFCGQANVPLRGHRDSGKLLLDEGDAKEGPAQRDGIFRSLLRFRVDAGDDVLKTHLENSKANAPYISPETQNEIIDCFKEEIQSIILERVREAPAYSVIFDETSDVSHIEQLTVSFRYVHKGVCREDFITFKNCYASIRPEDIADDSERRLTGHALAHIVQDLIIAKFTLDPKKCVGIGTDNCSVMASDAKGAVEELKKTLINARRCPCANHMLNNSLAKTSKVIPCKTATGTIKKVIAFANASPKRHHIFKKELGTAMKGLCETRWAEKHDGHLQFRENLAKVCTALETISTWDDHKTSSEAFCLLSALRSSQFIISLMCLCDILGTTASLSRSLQSSSLDLKKASDAISDTVSVLEGKRQNANDGFKRLYEECKNTATELGTEITTPRTVCTQLYRQNQPAESAQEYYRRAIYIPLLDNILADISDRFPSDTLGAFDLRLLLPSKQYMSKGCCDMNRDAVLALATKYKYFVSSPTAVVEEYYLWVNKWDRELKKLQEQENDKETSYYELTVLEIVEHCDRDMYPNIRILLIVLATLPVSVATGERSFSTLRRIKTWLRNRMGEERLCGLALLHIHQELMITVDKIIARFAKSGRRLDFVI